MLVTRKTKIPLHWIFFAQLPFTLTIWANYFTYTPFLYAVKKFIDNPAAITFLISLEVFITILGGPFVNWLSDHVWTGIGRRKPFIAAAVTGQVFLLPLIPFAPNLWTLIALKWAYGILGDLSTPNQPLTMEVVPTSQRGKGSGFFSMQIQLVNIVFFGTVIGRFDDIYFMGPLHGLTQLSGEALMFFSGSVTFLAVLSFTMLAIKEIEPPDRLTLADCGKPGDGLLKKFFQGFVKDILSKVLLPLYLLQFVAQMANLSLGLLGPLLYTDQWGYSLQEMGTNFAIGAAINACLAIAAGVIADATSKMKVYVVCLLGGVTIKIAWVFFVMSKPDQRPELWEILLFGELGSVFSVIAGVVLFPMTLEYVERNRLGIASAGMGLFSQLARNLIQVFVGLWVFAWSVFFLPQAGALVDAVFDRSADRQEVTQRLEDGGLATKKLHLEPLHPPGVDGPTSQQWRIRQHDETIEDLLKEKKKLENRSSKLRAGFSATLADDQEQAEYDTKIAEIDNRMAEIGEELAQRSSAFTDKVEQAMGQFMYDDGQQLVTASREGPAFDLTLRTVEPVTQELAEKLAEGLYAEEFAVSSEVDETGMRKAELDATPGGAERAVRIHGEYDPRFLALDEARFDAGLSRASLESTLVEWLSILRSGISYEPGVFELLDPAFVAHDPVTFTATLTTVEPMSAEEVDQLAEVLSESSKVASAEATLGDAGIAMSLTFDGPLSPVEAWPQDAVARRLVELLPDDDYGRDRLYQQFNRVVDTAASHPVFLTVPRPVVDARGAVREYDYFFSVYLLMITTDFLGLGVIALLIWLEKKGYVRRYGVEEDARRAT